MKGARRITKRRFYDLGGFANSKLFRKADKFGRWMHFELID